MQIRSTIEFHSRLLRIVIDGATCATCDVATGAGRPSRGYTLADDEEPTLPTKPDATPPHAAEREPRRAGGRSIKTLGTSCNVDASCARSYSIFVELRMTSSERRRETVQIPEPAVIPQEAGRGDARGALQGARTSRAREAA